MTATLNEKNGVRPYLIEHLPGPRPLPVLGNALQIETSRLHLVAEGWLKEYGDPYTFRLGKRRFLVTGNPENIAAVLRDRPEGFQRTTRLSNIAREMHFGGVFSSNGERWRAQRPMVMAGFDPAHIKSYFPALLNVTERFARRWRKAADAGTEIDLVADLMRYTVDVTAGLAFGADINTLESDDEVIQQHLDKVLPALFRRAMAPFQYWRYFKLPVDHALARHIGALDAAVQGFIAAARKRMDAEPALRSHPRNLIEAMIAARDAEGSNLTDGDVAGNVLTMLLAGEDTTANTLAWMVWLLSRNPRALARAQEEVKSALKANLLEWRLEDINSLQYVEGCIHETMRLRPVAPIIVNEAARDSTVAGVQVKKGQLVLCLMRPGPTDAKHFPQPAEFDPARWLEKSTTSNKRVAMPFGAGPRLCPGRYLALLEMKMVMAMFVAQFRIDRVGTENGADPAEHLALTMAPVGLRMKLGRAAAA